MNFDDDLKQKVSNIEHILEKFLPKEEGYQRTVLEAMNYSVLAGGKRLRPMIMKEAFHLFRGEDTILVEPFMAAMEMIHTYSLVHDDLPAMDNDEYRRGRKTTHVVFGEAMAILAGDGLLNYAFETASKAFSYIEELPDTMDTSIRYQRVGKAIQILANKAGIYGMIGGQTVDVEETENNTDRDRLDFIYRLKTGALIEASFMIGAVLAGAEEEAVKKIERIASNVGLAFQIKDDILDVTSTTEVLGKPVHSDEKNEKITYVTLMGIEQASQMVYEASQKALEEYDTFDSKNEYLRELIIKLINREK
ncbi:MAG: hypothetical protein K0S47_3346 [Herbinix sp.]|jgi:geranylgeranyl diphosphate synthase type II|nr:hypothetical protein [Herbinix sp.]